MTSRRNPFEELERLFDRMSDQFEGGDWSPGLSGLQGLGVAVDVADRGDQFVVTADLPGFDKEEIDVQLRGDTLQLSAEREEATEEAEEGRYVRRERRTEAASRSVTLPEEVDQDGVSAEYQNGVLTVTLPKAQAAAESHRIEVE